MKKLLLALFVLMTVAGYSFADDAPPTLIWEWVPNGSTLVDTYRVGIRVDPTGAGISVIDNISITAGTGLPVQIEAFSSFPTAEEDFATFLGPDKILDTHILTQELKAITGGTLRAGQGWTEDNDGSLAGLVGTLPHLGGLGELYLADDSSSITLDDYNEVFPDGLYELTFLQVVVPVGKTVVVSGRYTNPARIALGLDPIPFGIVPEPSTFVMLVLGALCVVGIRLRRK